MSRVPRIDVDFNGLFGGILCISHTDTCLDESGAEVNLQEGMVLTAFDGDADDESVLVATGTVERAPDELACQGSRWVLRIDQDGVTKEEVPRQS